MNKKIVKTFLLFLFTTLSCVADTYSNAEYGFSLAIPAGYRNTDKTTETMRGIKWDANIPSQKAMIDSLSIIVASFLNTESKSQIIFVNAFKGKQIGSEPLPIDQLPIGAFIERIGWSNHLVDCVRTTTRYGGIDSVRFVIQIPLKPHAIQIEMFGPVSYEPDILKSRNELLASLQGATNWDDPKTSRAGASAQEKIVVITKFLIYVALACAALWSVIRMLYKK